MRYRTHRSAENPHSSAALNTCSNELHTSNLVRACPDCYEDMARRLASLESERDDRTVRLTPLGDRVLDAWEREASSTDLRYPRRWRRRREAVRGV